MSAGEPLVTAVAGVVFGLALAAPPGPMNAVIAEESALNGWAAGFVTGLGAMVSDVCFFLLALVGVVAVVQREPLLEGAMILTGGVLMLYFAYGAVADAQQAFHADETAPESDDGVAWAATSGFRKAFLLGITNPYQIAFWLTVGVGLLQPGTLDVLARAPAVGDALAGWFVVRTGSPLLIAGLFAGVLGWILSFPAALVAAGRRVDRLAPLIAVASGAVLAGFGVYFLVDGVTTLA